MHWRVHESFSTSPKHSMDWSCDQTQTPTQSFWHKHTHTSMHMHSRALVNNLFDGTPYSYAPIHIDSCWTDGGKVRGFTAGVTKGVDTWESRRKTLTDAHMLTKKFHKTSLPKLFSKSVMVFFLHHKKMSILECHIKTQTHTHKTFY